MNSQIDDEKKNDYVIRTLEIEDYDKNYFGLLSQLTKADKPERDDWTKRFNEIKNANLTKIFVVEHENQIIASLTCYLELKFIRNLGSICHIEDFVIDENHRKHGLGTKLLDMAKEFAKLSGSYKIILDGRESVAKFYEKNGFKKTSNGMTIYFVEK